jgi:hypothetical protein
MAGFIEREQWQSFLDEFTRRNQQRATQLEIIGEIGDQEEEEFLPLVGVNLESKGSDAGSVVVILGGQTQRHAEHLITNVQRIAPLIGQTGLEDGLGFEDNEGTKTLLIFEQLA